MNKPIRKILASVLLSVLVAQTTVYSVSAKVEAKIPDRMAPWTIIEYKNNTEYSILSGGISTEKIVQDVENTQKLLKYSNFTSSEIKANEEFERNLTRSKNELLNKNAIKIENPAPCKGMKVTYDGEGLIKNIEMVEVDSYRTLDVNNASLISADVYLTLPIGTTSPIGTYYWGSSNNMLDVQQSFVLGSGRITTFIDTIGERDNILKKGDVATKRDLDNPSFGKELTVTANNRTITMYKRDNGALPDAVLDVWKTGVEYFGYQWSSTLSFGGSYFYYR